MRGRSTHSTNLRASRAAAHLQSDGENTRVIAVGLPHYITQRGNGRRAVFHAEEDRTVYLQLLREYGERYAVRWWSYCLMSNHVHLVQFR